MSGQCGNDIPHPRHRAGDGGVWYTCQGIPGWHPRDARAEPGASEGLRNKVRAALTSEDEIAHGEAWSEERGGLGECAYCDMPWPCRTQRGIDRLHAALEAASPVAESGLDVERLAKAMHADISTCLFPNDYRMRGPDMRAHRAVAEVVAREYAALAAESSEGETS